jgi:substrate-binding family protein
VRRRRRGHAGDGTITVTAWSPQQAGGAGLPGMPAMARAYARYVKAHGGVDGRRLRVLTCDVHEDSEGTARCVSRAVAAGAVAVVGAPTAGSATRPRRRRHPTGPAARPGHRSGAPHRRAHPANTKVTCQRVRDGRLAAVHRGFVDVARTLGGVADDG